MSFEATTTRNLWSAVFVRILACAWLFMIGVWTTSAIEPRGYVVEVTAQTIASPPEIQLRWPYSPDAGQYVVYRKTRDNPSWGSPIATLPANSTGFNDVNVAALIGYEYQVVENKNLDPFPNGNTADWLQAYGYVYAGYSLPFVTNRGYVLLVVDSSIAGAIGDSLGIFTRDLVSDGWRVARVDVGRGDSVTSVRQRIKSVYDSSGQTLSAVFLIGHVPVPYSGDIAPDLHETHRGAWPADAFYGDMDGSWTDSFVWQTDTEEARNVNVHGDGKFDQSRLPSPVELEIGRVDFANLSAIPMSEVDLLRQYFRKNHAFRHKQFDLPRRGLLRDNFGVTDGDAPAASAWRTFVPMFGSGNVVEVAPSQYFPRLSNEGFLWSFGAGGGTWDHADGVGYSADFFREDPRTVFAILHGSYFGDWDSENNFLRAALTAPTYTLAAIWAGLPHWFMHHMALGESLGFATRLAQNNVDTYKSEMNLSANLVHVALIGDPTLRMQYIAPPRNVRGTIGDGITIHWDPSPEPVSGYHVFRADNPAGPFLKLNRFPVQGTSYTDTTAGGSRPTYMIRAAKLLETASGSYQDLSHGTFWDSNGGPVEDPAVVSIVALAGGTSEKGLQPVKFRISRRGSLTFSLSLNLVTSGSATTGADYTLSTLNPTMPAGVASVEVTLTPLTDTAVEGSEQVTLSLQAGSGYSIEAPQSATITIEDLPPEEPAVVSVVALSGTTSENGVQPVNFRISRRGSVTSPLSLNLVASGSATIGADYTLSTLNPTMPAGASSVEVTLTPLRDEAVEGSEQVTLTLQAGSGYLIEAPQSATITIEDLPPEEPAVVSVVALNGATSENGLQSVLFRISRRGSLSAGLDLEVVAGGSATIGADYTLSTLSPVMAAGVATVDVTLTPLLDDLVEGSEHVTLTLQPGAGYTVESPQSATVTIEDLPPKPATPPRIENVTLLPDGRSQLTFSGDANTNCAIQASPNLIDWTEVARVRISENGVAEYIDPIPSSEGARFYRLVVLP